jgi:hypothetical protein
MTFKELLLKYDVGAPFREWAGDKTWQEVYNTCERGDWLLWLFAKTNPKDKRLITLAKGYCAKTVRHLMKDKRSKAAVDAAIAYGKGKIYITSLEKAKKAAYRVHSDNCEDDFDGYNFRKRNYASFDAAYCAYASVETTNSDYAEYTATQAAIAAANAANGNTIDFGTVYYTARKESQRKTADIVRKYITIDKFNVNTQPL